MDEPEHTDPDAVELIRKLHERPQMLWAKWLQAPAHVYYKTFRMNDPPAQRSASRDEFKLVLDAFKVSADEMVIQDAFGYGMKSAKNGDRLIVIWQTHTEYYSYQIWHIPTDQSGGVVFGPMAFPDYRFPITPLGAEVCHPIS